MCFPELTPTALESAWTKKVFTQITVWHGIAVQNAVQNADTPLLQRIRLFDA